MGCPCRQIRTAIEHLPGGKFLTGLLPALPPEKGPPMKMLARVPGQTFHLAHGPIYRADHDCVVDVMPGDVAEMRRVGCVEAPAASEIAPEPATPAPEPATPAPMPAPEQGTHWESLEEFAASLPDGAVPAAAEHSEQ